MRRRATVTTLVIALTLTPLLGACSLLQRLPLPGIPGPVSSAGPLGIGSCLDGMVGADSDRAATVPCGELHLYEVTAIEEWPGMADALTTAGDAGALWDDIHGVDGSSEAAIEYGMWASRTCNDAGQRMVGVAGVEVEGHTASELWLRIGGSHGVDLSLASRNAFTAGDHRTVCALAWYQNGQSPQRVEGPRFSELLSPGLPIERRECWDSEYYGVSCARPHAVQALVGFDGIAAFGAELIGRMAQGEPTDADWSTADAFCEALLQQVLPVSASLDGLGYLAETAAGTGWDEYDGQVDPEGSYPFFCLAVGLQAGDLIEGDVFEGDAVIVAATGADA